MLGMVFAEMPGSQGLTSCHVAPCCIHNSDRKIQQGGGLASDLKDRWSWRTAEQGAKKAGMLQKREMEFN